MIEWNLIALAAYLVLLVAAAAEDLRLMRISNLISVAVLVVAIAHALPHPWENLISFAIVLGVCLVLFRIGWLGGGDAKLFAGAAAWFELHQLPWFLAAVFIGGALLTIILLPMRAFLPSPNPEGHSWAGLRRGRSVPYGVAIAAGAALVALTVS